MTGQEFDEEFDQKVDKAYSAYLDNTKKERLYKMALYEAIELKYQSGDKQKLYDELAGLIRTNYSVVPVSNELINTNTTIIAIDINATTVDITTLNPHNLSNGNTVTVTEVVSSGALAGAINGNTYTVTVINAYKFRITLTTTGTYTSGGILQYPSGGILPDYLHILAMKTRFDKSVGTISTATAASPGKITITAPLLRSGMKVKISGATGMTSLNGTFYVKKVGTNKFTLYTNKALDIPATTTGSYNVNSATLYVCNEYWAKPIFPDRKFSTYSDATVTMPRYEEAQEKFKIYPLDETCNYAYVDYITEPNIFIDPTDDTTVLTATYTQKFLYFVLDVAAKLFAGPTRDQILLQTERQEIIDNP